MENKIYQKIMGIDLSLTGAGISIIETKTKNVVHQELISTKKKTTKKHDDQTRLAIFNSKMELQSEEYIPSSVLVDMPRLVFIRNRVRNLILEHKPDFVVIEGYAMSGFGRGVSGLLEIGGIIRMTIFDLNVPYIQVPPLNAKAFISGFSTASKEMIISSIYERYDLLIENDNIADSFALAMMYVEFGEKIHEYLVKGGVDKLKELRVSEIRNSSNKIIAFQKLLKMGELTLDDVNLAIEFLNKNKNRSSSAKDSELLGISEDDFDQLKSEKPKLNQINDKYRFKKVKKSKKKKNKDELV